MLDIAILIMCYSLALPDGCKSFKAPHLLECYRTIWAEAGCLLVGKRYPATKEVVQRSDWDTLNVE